MKYITFYWEAKLTKEKMYESKQGLDEEIKYHDGLKCIACDRILS